MKTVYIKELSPAEPIALVYHNHDSVNLHKHSFFELVYVQKGKAEHILGDSSSIIGEKDFFLLEPKVAHEYRPLGTEDSLSVINCLFLSDGIDDTLSGIEDFYEILSRFLPRHGLSSPKASPVGQVFHDESGMVGDLMNHMLREYREKRAGYREILRHLLQSLVLCLLRSVAGEEDRPAVGMVRDIRDYVNRHYASPLSLSALCRELHFSLPYASSVFHRETGVTFRVYLGRIRIEKACRYLRLTDCTVEEIAGKIGYSDPAFFYKSFRREMAMTPDEYRRLNQAQSANEIL